MQIISNSLNPQEWTSGAWAHRFPVRYRIDRNSRVVGMSVDVADIGCEILEPVGSTTSVRGDEQYRAPMNVRAASLDYI